MKHVIKRPLVTEKNTYHNAAGVYVFEVNLDSDKPEIRAAVEKVFKVKVESVKTSVCRGHAKTTKFGLGKIPKWKKAYVKLAAGEKIALFEGV
jgi:large subunit ribosomal protein L23